MENVITRFNNNNHNHNHNNALTIELRKKLFAWLVSYFYLFALKEIKENIVNNEM